MGSTLPEWAEQDVQGHKPLSDDGHWLGPETVGLFRCIGTVKKKLATSVAQSDAGI